MAQKNRLLLFKFSDLREEVLKKRKRIYEEEFVDHGEIVQYSGNTKYRFQEYVVSCK